MEEPVADAIRSILDGHVVLSRDLANQNHYPAIDVLKSISRCMADVVDDDHRKSSRELLSLMAHYRDNEDLVTLGAYQKGSDARLDLAIKLREKWLPFLRQDREETTPFAESKSTLVRLAAAARIPVRGK
jgi:flagellum-specific ATP synthase